MENLLLILAAVFVFAVVLHVIATRRERTSSDFEIEVLPPRTSSSDPFQKLVAACFGDRAKAQRLLDYEIRRDPNLLFDDAARRALERLAADRSR